MLFKNFRVIQNIIFVKFISDKTSSFEKISAEKWEKWKSDHISKFYYIKGPSVCSKKETQKHLFQLYLNIFCPTDNMKPFLKSLDIYLSKKVKENSGYPPGGAKTPLKIAIFSGGGTLKWVVPRIFIVFPDRYLFSDFKNSFRFSVCQKKKKAENSLCFCSFNLPHMNRPLI